VKYEEGVPENWTAGLDGLSVQKEGEIPVILGPCPRCGDKLRRSFEEQKVRAANPRQTVRVILRCNCSVDHEGRPPGKEGCGAFGGVQIQL
jgi:hypothetical protein